MLQAYIFLVKLQVLGPVALVL